MKFIRSEAELQEALERNALLFCGNTISPEEVRSMKAEGDLDGYISALTFEDADNHVANPRELI